jgi:hypothetical protein
MWGRFVICFLIALSWCSNGSATPADDELPGVQCLQPGPWRVVDFGFDEIVIPAEFDCFDIETGEDVYDA